MRDEIDSRMWVAHHDQFNQWVDDSVAALRRRLGGISDQTRPLLMMVAAAGMTLLTFGASVA